MLEGQESLLDGIWDVGGTAEHFLCFMDGTKYRTNFFGICYKHLWSKQEKGCKQRRGTREEWNTHPLPAMVMKPTVFSGLESTFVWKRVVTASD